MNIQLGDLKNPAERKKLFAASVLGLVAIVFLWWTFFGFGGAKPVRTVPQTARDLTATTQPVKVASEKPEEIRSKISEQVKPIVFHPLAIVLPGGTRNIFAFYEKPPAPTQAATPTPTPTPTPPLLLATVNPSNVYARTGDFTLEVTGDKFTPQLKVSIDGRDAPTRYISPQQLSAVIPAALIATPGGRQVLVRSADSKLYSNSLALNVSAPPTPNYTYVGILGTARYTDTAILQDRSSREILNVRRGDLLAGRFRVTSISEREVVLIDQSLKIKHTLPFSSSTESGIAPQPYSTPRVQNEDDEP